MDQEVGGSNPPGCTIGEKDGAEMTKETEKTDSFSHKAKALWFKRDNFVIFIWIVICPPVALYVSHAIYGDDVPLATAISAFFVATGGLYLAGKRTAEMNRTNEIALKRNAIEEGRNATDILSRALEQLGNEDSLVVRQGGIFILRQLGEGADKTDDVRKTIIRTLVAFVRNRVLMQEERVETGRAKYVLKAELEKREEKLDVEDAIHALASIAEGEEERGSVDLSSTDLRNLLLERGADLSFFRLSFANLSGTELRRANLSRARLGLANLSGTDSRQANLSRARLGLANLSGADLRRANFSGAHLWRANFSGAELGEANLSRADLTNADLFGAGLIGAELGETNLRGAGLGGANFSAANLGGVQNLTQDHLDDIRYYGGLPPRDLPEGLVVPDDEEKNIIKPGDWDYDEDNLKRLKKFKQDVSAG